MVKRILILAAALVLAASFASGSVWARGKPTPVKSDDSTTKVMRPGQDLKFDAGTGVSVSVGGDGTGVSVYITSTSSGGGTPGNPPGTLQANVGGAFTGVNEIKVSANSSGVTTVFGMSTAGATVYALNWQGYTMVGYYPSGQTDYLKDSSGVTTYDAAGNPLWSTINGFYISGIAAPSADITMKTAVFDTSRSGVSIVGPGQLSGTSIMATVYGCIYVNESASAVTAFGVLPMGSGSTEYFRGEELSGSGMTIYSVSTSEMFRLNNVEYKNLFIPPGNNGAYFTAFARSILSGTSKWWKVDASSGVSGMN